MNVLLTSCGLETPAITDEFLSMLPVRPAEARALFITAAANNPDAIEVLPKCLNDLLKCGVPRQNITVSDLYDPMDGPLSARWEAVYLCGGDTRCLLRRVRESGFRERLLAFIDGGGAVLGVSAGSVIFAGNHPGNLGLLACPLDVHCPDETRERPGRYPLARQEKIRLGNRQMIRVEADGFVVME